MREIRTSGSEGGGIESNRFSLPLSGIKQPRHCSSMQPCVYILASHRNGTLYTGVTSDLSRRAWEHKRDAVDGFTNRYGVHRLVYVEFHPTMTDAIAREKRIKKWRRA
jgi:putative endonuclease